MTKKKKELTELQERFLDLFMEERFKGDLRLAMREAGYNDTTTIAQVVNSLREEMVQRIKGVLATKGMKAAFALGEVIDSPDAVGNSNKLKAANSILERIGVREKEDTNQIDVPQGGIIILPAKGTRIVAEDGESD